MSIELVTKWRAQANSAMRRSGTWSGDQMADRIESMSDELEAALQQQGEAGFKNFHRSLCKRFGYTHDDAFWWRDQVSLEEHIAALTHPPKPVDVSQMVNRFLAWKLPPEFCPDNGISFTPVHGVPSWTHPIGTNLFTADQARAMFEHCIEGMTPKPVVSDSDLDVIALNAARKCFGVFLNYLSSTVTQSQTRARMQIIIRDALAQLSNEPT